MARSTDWVRKGIPARVLAWPRWLRYGLTILIVGAVIAGATGSSKKPPSSASATKLPAGPATTPNAVGTTAPPISGMPTTLTPATTAAPPTTKAPSPSAGLTPAQRSQIQSILTGALQHYATEFSAGEAVADHRNNDFYDWRHSTNIETDVQTYQSAFGQADAFYNANDEPPSISAWRDDMGILQGDITYWINAVVDWQTGDISGAQLAQDDSKVHADIATVQDDISKLLAGQ